jgi:hypothetical protein
MVKPVMKQVTAMVQNGTELVEKIDNIEFFIEVDKISLEVFGGSASCGFIK